MNDLYRQSKSVGEKMFHEWESFEDCLAGVTHFESREQIHQEYDSGAEMAVEEVTSDAIRKIMFEGVFRL